ncbi:TRAP transporter small permease [Oceanidesulfovibrio indonesiensis]|uniref:TRAP transporter small permease n=1 Tax=Oceanidesulfovibrio indonesiensis TaxID=54767 RepID=A0A7M3MHG2_9BACT|nr:TRAP transporter small permease [Oceanidesulfovibrio indonesiensis]TVM18371.1 TRAP transporter small permease [Oceanidesulfovibrio indonesiensis]
MRRLIAIVEGLSNAGALLSVLAMAAIVVLILLEIFVRAAFGSSTQVASEYSGYLMVALCLLGFAYSFREKAFIRINLLVPRLPRVWQRRVEACAGLAGFAITVYVFIYAVSMTYGSWELGMKSDTMAETPFWIPQLAVPLGLAMLGLQLLAFVADRLLKQDDT